MTVLLPSFAFAEKVTSGILSNTRQSAVARLEKLDVRRVAHLESLIDDVTKSEIQLEEKNDTNTKPFNHGLEVSADDHYVYAQTAPSASSATRFFPAALQLPEDQLVRLHIHEALHRTLPESIRSNESAVEEITLAICDPKANFESVQGKTIAAIAKYQPLPPVVTGNGPAADSAVNTLKNPSVPEKTVR